MAWLGTHSNNGHIMVQTEDGTSYTIVPSGTNVKDKYVNEIIKADSRIYAVQASAPSGASGE